MKKLEQRSSGSPRSSGAGSDPLEELFERARGDGFTREETDELWSRVGAAMGAPTPRGRGSASTAGAMGYKAVAALLIGGGLVATGVAARGWHSSDRAPMGVTGAVATSRPDAGPLLVQANEPPLEVVQTSALPVPSEPLRVASKTRPVVSPERRDVERVNPPQRRLESDDTPPSVPESPITAAAPSPPPLAPRPSLQDRDTARAPAPIDPALGEGALLLHARQALASDPHGALELTQEHARRFPAGALVPEREVLAIEALARLGRASEARSRLAAFRERFPQSPHVARLEALLAR
jgi:hypothetical protein